MSKRPGNAFPCKAEIFEHWRGLLHEHKLFVDWGEPSCWACGFHYGVKHDIKNSEASLTDIHKAWERIPLQRCHIVPRSLGGANTPDNLFLLCRECHDLAPNTSIPSIFLEWVRSQSWLVREQAKLNQALASFSVSEQDYPRITETIASKPFRAWAQSKVGRHWPQSNYAPTSSRLTPASIVGLAVHYLGEHYSDAGEGT